MDAGAFFRFRRELFQTKVKIHKRLFALLLVFALIVGIIPTALADNEPDISAVESTKEALVDFQSEAEPIISPPMQSILETDEAVEDSEVDTEIEAPTSMDGETLTRTDNGGVMLLGGGGTMGKSTCVTFAAYQSGRWKCHRYEVDGSHSYVHYFYTSEIAYHTIDGVDAYSTQLNTNPSKTEKEKTELSSTDSLPISQKRNRTEVTAAEMQQYREIIAQNISYDLLRQEYPHQQEQLEEILEILVETVCTTRQTVRVAGNNFPVEIVKARLLKLTAEHIRFVLGCLSRNTTKIRPI